MTIRCVCDGTYERLTAHAWVRCRRCGGSRLRRLWLRLLRRSVLLTVVLTACTPQQVQQWSADVAGLDLTDDVAAEIAAWIDTDCLPNEDASVRVECGIRDSHAHYRLDGLGISLDRWARVAWCESRYDEDAVNGTSGALGAYQHLPRYWPARLDRSGWEHVDGEAWNDGRLAAFVSGMLARESGGLGPWAASAHCWQGTP